MKLINTTEAIGHVLAHDITQIIKGVSSGRRFKKGDVVRADDIEVLLSLGKEHLYVLELSETQVHENEAAGMLYALCKNDYFYPGELKEGKIEVFASRDGLFQVDVERLEQVNALGDMIIATRHHQTFVKAGDKVAGMRIIPLVIEKANLQPLDAIYQQGPLLSLKPIEALKVGVVTTGSEVFYGRIQDTFTTVIADKLAEFGLTIQYHEIVDDVMIQIKSAILRAREQGMTFIICTGGMSVDPDDVTPLAIQASGADIVTYGTPMLPGAMLLVGYFEDGVPIVGLPGCAMYAKATSFDVYLPRLLTHERLTKAEMVKRGHGGLCLGCATCHYPQCGFGKG